MSIKYIQDDNGNYYTDENGNLLTVDVSGEGSGTPLVEITYDELKALRDDGKLVAGQYYCITDYVCTTTQENTRATTNTSFNIIVQALSNCVLSENASACSKGGKNPTLIDSVITNKEVKSRVVVHYREYVDYGVEAGVDADYRQGKDIFVDYGYVENNNGDTVPVIYKTDARGVDPTRADYNDEFEGADYEDIFFYEGTAEIDGVIYDKWRLINELEGVFTWDSSNKSYVYTNQIVNNGLITIDDFLYEEETDEYRIDSSAVVLSYYEFVDSSYGYGLMTDDGKKFAAFEYLEDNNGNIVPVLHDWVSDGDTIGYNENYYYVGKATIDGQVYDKWRKIELDAGDENDFSWDTEGKAYYYTNVIVDGGISSNSNINFSAWEIKYSLDNDKTRFWWAMEATPAWFTSNFDVGTWYATGETYEHDGATYYVFFNEGVSTLYSTTPYPTKPNEIYIDFDGSGTLEDDNSVINEYGGGEEGKGVIYYMKDEYGNECPYDFKNIQFKRWATDDEIANDDKFYSSWDDTGNDFCWCYTFMAYGTSNDTWADASNIKPYRYFSDEGGMPCINNIIKPFIEMYEGSEETNAKEGLQWLNNIVLYGGYEDNPIFSDNYEYNAIQCPCGNKFGINNRSMTLGKGYGCKYNTFGDSCQYNTFGSNCSRNTFGYGCDFNTFGFGCNSNSIDDGCFSNSFGDSCNYNTFGIDSSHNTFGNGCNSNSFGDYCQRNTFGESCQYNTFGNDSSANTFGYNCSYNSLGSGCSNNTFGINCSYNILDPSVQGSAPQPTAGEKLMRGVHIHYGVTGQFTVVRGATYTQDVRTANDVTITV